jgi:hypothetical protein
MIPTATNSSQPRRDIKPPDESPSSGAILRSGPFGGHRNAASSGG